MEIGSYNGGSLQTFGRCMEHGATLIAIDRPMGRTDGGAVLKGVAGELREEGYDVRLILGDSQIPEIVAEATSAVGKGLLDVLFIDGDHSSIGVNADVKNYTPMVRPGGLVIFHDVGPCAKGINQIDNHIKAIFPAWEALGRRHNHKMIVQTRTGYGLVWINRK